MLPTPRHIKRVIDSLAPPSDDSNLTLALQLELWAQKQPAQTFLLYRDQKISYAEANAAINRHAHAYAGLGIGRGDVVALLMENRPEYLFHVYGLHKLGAVVALINTHLSGSVLVHAIRSCAPRHVMVGSELWPAFAAIRGELPELPADAVHVDVDSVESDSAALDLAVPLFNSLCERASPADPESSKQQRLGDLAAYIYTSGTTGLPKAALIRHERLFRAGSAWSSLAIAYRPGDVMYNCLPLYHANGFLLATGSVVTAGTTLALARRFSRQRFWDEIRAYRATSFIYIGELCRYLMNSEPTPRDREHSVRAITGNGLRPDIWPALQKRFGIARVAEFYGATEGNSITVNFANIEGSVGPRMPGMVLARYSEADQDFIRDARGFLQTVSIGEPGILLGKIRGRKRFDGYRDKAETESKVLRNAFKPGDAYFNTGDLLKCDFLWHLHFTDRVGDTFRWKGENVATTEVQEQISKWNEVAEVAVYGVQLPGIEGRAGMAALVLSNGHPFDPAAFKAHVDAHLPSYARPLFVRVQRELEKTSTMKVKKNELQKQGFDPTRVEGPLYFRHPERAQAYVPLDTALYTELTSGRLRV